MTESEIISLKEHFNCRIQEAADAHAREHAMLAKVLDQTAAMLAERLAHLNQFREDAVSDRGRYVDKIIFESSVHSQEVVFRAIGEQNPVRIEALETGRASLKSQILTMGSAAIAFLVVLEFLIRYVLN